MSLDDIRAAERITVWFNDGTKREWRHAPRPGGSWQLCVKFSDGWVTVIDEYEHALAFPESKVSSVDVEPPR